MALLFFSVVRGPVSACHRTRPSAIGFASGECRAGSGEARRSTTTLFWWREGQNMWQDKTPLASSFSSPAPQSISYLRGTVWMAIVDQ